MELEYRGKKFLMRWDPKKEIFFFKSWGKHDEKIAKEFCVKFREFWKEFVGAKKIKMLIEVDNTSEIDRKGREIYYKLTKEKIFLSGGKFAIYGASSLIKMIVEFLFVFLTKRTKINLKFFTSKEKALKWLKSK